jgi:hypothetical protein
MLVSFRFFDKEEWSIHTTILTIISLVIFRLGFKNINKLNILVFASLISMITPETNLLYKLLFVFFMCLMCWNKKDFLIGTVLALIASIITFYIPENNTINQTIQNNKLIKYSNVIVLILWFALIGYKIIDYVGVL